MKGTQNKTDLIKEGLQELVKNHSPPSIPSGDFRYGYKIDEQQHKVISLKSLFKLKMIGETPENYLGPGYYHVTDNILTKRRGGAVPYAQDTSRRTKVEQINKNSKVIGPGSYEISKKV